MVPEGEDAVKSLIIAPKGDANSARGDNPRGLMKEDIFLTKSRFQSCCLLALARVRRILLPALLRERDGVVSRGPERICAPTTVSDDPRVRIFISKRDIATARRPRPSRARLGGGRICRRRDAWRTSAPVSSFTADTRAFPPARALTSVPRVSLSSQLVNRMGSGKQMDGIMDGVAPGASPDGAPHPRSCHATKHPPRRDATRPDLSREPST